MTDLRTAEMIKYASNAFLATRISFINEIGNMCEDLGADVREVAQGMGLDKRIGRHFLDAGLGWGGSCFPKDVKALHKSGKDENHDFQILSAVLQINKKQKTILLPKIEAYFKGNLKDKKIALWGLAFKPETDDIREAPALEIIEALLDKGATISAFDPEAMPNVEKKLGNQIDFAASMYKALENADALVICTEWSIFRTPNFEKMKTLLNNHIIFDGRNLYEVNEIKEQGFTYLSIGRPATIA